LRNLSYEDPLVWAGEIVEVDPVRGCLYVSLHDPERTPQTGVFLVRPFEFLRTLNSVYNDAAFQKIRRALPGRLAATLGGIHPRVTAASTSPEDAALPQLRRWWTFAWNILWGPPGTGKTYTAGRQIAQALNDPAERILVVSTTNRATDAIAVSLGMAAKSSHSDILAAGQLLRIGKGANWSEYERQGVESLLQNAEADLLVQVDDLARQLTAADAPEEKAGLRNQIASLLRRSGDRGRQIAVDPAVRVVVCTVFRALSVLDLSEVRQMIETDSAPFTTVIIDEAGLVSRAVVAALSLLASRRVVLVGDSKQLAPISRLSRILPQCHQVWLAGSALGHLREFETDTRAVHMLRVQRRMHPDVCRIVSNYQYGGHLITADDVLGRNSSVPSRLKQFSRAVWYVIDADADSLETIRADRGPGNSSWIRHATAPVLQKLFGDREHAKANGLFISPFRAQADAVGSLLRKWKLKTWEASTVHCQQGSEADIVIFDTVNAGNYSWPYEEWKRLINVGISRAREAVIVIASRAEMREPYLQSLSRKLTPAIARQTSDGLCWVSVDGLLQSGTEAEGRAPLPPDSLGGQIQAREQMRPILSREQQRLCGFPMDGRPRLVRGVAGSGKTLVLANWLVRTVRRMMDQPQFRVWAVYANRSLHHLLQEYLVRAWDEASAERLFDEGTFPWDRVSLLHVRDVLAGLLPLASLSLDDFSYDYDSASVALLEQLSHESLAPRCSAMFIDEAQDMGPATLRLLLSLVEQSDPRDHNSRSAHVFYDNAQNIYGRPLPVLQQLGLDLRGRSVIMKESFRSTRQLTELAVNLLARLNPGDELPDQKELLRLGLLEKTIRDGDEWLVVHYNQTHGPNAALKICESRAEEMQALAAHLIRLIQVEHVPLEKIVLLYNSPDARQQLEETLAPGLAAIGAELSVQTSRAFERLPNTLLVTTPHSFKGFESEVVFIPCADRFVTGDGQILSGPLYVAITRARSLLAIYATNTTHGPAAQLLQQLRRVCRH
ncbi:MAG: AAA family ATPase, partial [Planctomycetaceae bacterium]|nr:AAA family ATPase [Planctomycetaceae bacterium]